MKFLVSYSWVGKSWIGIILTIIYFFLVTQTSIWAIDFQFGGKVAWFIGVFYGLLFGGFVFMMRNFNPSIENSNIEYEKGVQRRSPRSIFIFAALLVGISFLIFF